jgi:charged multivesicular body protein 7
MKAYETSTATLKTVLSHPSLQRDHIDTTMDALSETMADQQEIDDAIQSGGQLAVSAAGMEADEDELAKELEGLVKEREEEVKEQQRNEAQDQERELAQRMAALKPLAATPPQSQPSKPAENAVEREEPSTTSPADEAWEAVYEEAQARRSAEAARAQEGRLKKEAKVYEAAQ